MTCLDYNLQKTVEAINYGQSQIPIWEDRVPALMKNLSTVAMIESTEHSNKMEGVKVGPDYLAYLGECAATPYGRDEQQLAGYLLTLNMIKEFGQYMELKPGLIKQLHQKLCYYLPETGGEWKVAENNIVSKEENGEEVVKFVTTPPLLVYEKMEEICNNYNRNKVAEFELLTSIAEFILDFLCVHPFPDGNGRVSRLLTLLMLNQAGYTVGNYISLERIVEENQENYYKALEYSSEGWSEGKNNPAAFVFFFVEMLMQAYAELAEELFKRL